MVIAGKTSNDSTKNSLVDLTYKPTKVDLSNKSSSEISKRVDDNKTTSKNEDFKEVLKSKSDSKDQDTQKVDVINKDGNSTEAADAEKLDELKQKLQELEDECKSGKAVSKDELNQMLSQLLNLLAKLNGKEVNLESDGKINTEALEMMIKGIGDTKSSDSSLSSVMEKMMEFLKDDSVKSSLDTDSLNLMKKLLSDLSANLTDNGSETTKDIKNNLKSLMSQVNDILDSKQNQKVLNLQEILNKNYSQDNKEGSNDNQDSNNTATQAESNKAATQKESKEVSKEDKFLNSLLDKDKDDSLNKINLFASRNAAVQTQGVNSVKDLSVNKATLVNDLIQDVKYMNTNSLKELTVKVNPGNLGEITIKLVQEDGLMKANLKANSKETTALLSQNLADIKKQLGDQNIKISDVNIDLYQEDTTFFAGKEFGGQSAGREQSEQKNGFKGEVSNDLAVSNDNLNANLAEDNSNINIFA